MVFFVDPPLGGGLNSHSLQFVEDSVLGEGGGMSFTGLFLVPTRTKPSAGGPVLYRLSLESSAYFATASL